MSQVVYGNSFSGGKIKIPPSKSAAHRAVLCAALSKGVCTLSNIDFSDDIRATIGAVESLGARTDYDKALTVDASQIGAGEAGIDCRESGSTLRFLIPVAAALGTSARFVGRGRLPERPLGIYEKLLPQHHVGFCSEGGLPLSISGRLTGGEYALPGNISSQFVTGLLFALPLVEEDSKITLTTPLESKGYVDMTVSILREFGISILETESGWSIPGGQSYRARAYEVEGDWSQAAFFLSMAALSPKGEPVSIAGLDADSLQGDKACVSLFEKFGLEVSWKGGTLTARNKTVRKPYGGLHGCCIDAAQIPDMVPALAVCAALCEGTTQIIHAERLRLKESDRLASMASALNTLGAKVEVTSDGLLIQGVPRLRGGTVLGENDHRVVMALAAAALRCDGKITVTDAHSIRKSYPGFYQDYKKLGGEAHVIDLG